jgi:hypothetical protein
MGISGSTYYNSSAISFYFFPQRFRQEGFLIEIGFEESEDVGRVFLALSFSTGLEFYLAVCYCWLAQQCIPYPLPTNKISPPPYSSFILPPCPSCPSW